MDVPQKRFWPYDEVEILRDDALPNRFLLSAPWLKFHFDIDSSHVDRANRALEALSVKEGLTKDHLDDINWFCSSLEKYPLCYILPRSHGFGSDIHGQVAQEIIQTSPREMLESMLVGSNIGIDPLVDKNAFIYSSLPAVWTWDTEAAIEFSKTNAGIDPESLFSIARRFHLLNDLEQNKTANLIEFASSLQSDPAKFQSASALIVRQNHYITEKCDGVVRSALPIAKNAGSAVMDFIQAEAGHDKILAKALKYIGFDPQQIPVISTTVALMEVFKRIAERNLLAFAMVVDIFERTSYRKTDPLTELLEKGGQTAAGQMADRHREINDSGEHENIAIGFLNDMAPIDSSYANESLRLAELATLVIHQLSAETLHVLKQQN